MISKEEVAKNLTKDNSWRNRAVLVLAYHESQIKIHGEPASGIKGGWSIRDTARELDLSPASIVHDLKIGRELSVAPDRLSFATSRNHALELINRTHSIKVELKTSRVPLAGMVIKSIQIEGSEFFYVKLDRPLHTEQMEVEHLMLPAYHFRTIKSE